MFVWCPAFAGVQLTYMFRVLFGVLLLRVSSVRTMAFVFSCVGVDEVFIFLEISIALVHMIVLYYVSCFC